MATVEDGDCIASIAATLGVRDYKTLWDANGDLKAKRPNPNQLVIGDSVTEATKTKNEKKAHGNRWTYVVKPKLTISLRIVVLGADDKPLNEAAWELTKPIAKNGSTSADGLIEIKEFPATEKEAVLKVTPKKVPVTPVVAPPSGPVPSPPPYPAAIVPDSFKDKKRAADPADDFVEWTLKVGSIPSFNEETGVLARLFNLGAPCQPGDDGSRTERTVKSYQKGYLNQNDGSGKPADIQTDLRDRHDKKP
jgi:hypothetical protein